jgi:hypothetical protein
LNRHIQILVLLLLLWFSCDSPTEIAQIDGCNDADSCTYDPNVNNYVNGSCLFLDDCGVCDGGNADQDCAGDCNGDASLDNCGTCDSDASNNCTADCNGDFGGNAIVDECGVCGGDGPEDNFNCGGECTVGTDCNGDCGGNAIVDECGVCGGDESSCLLFTKEDFADETLSENQDCIVEDICLTRGLNQPLYNAVYYDSYSDMMTSYSLGDSVLIKWSEGTVSEAELGNLIFGNSLQEIGGLTTITSKDIVGYIVNLDIYLNFNFLEWTVGVPGCSDCTGGGFSYIRDIIIPAE